MIMDVETAFLHGDLEGTIYMQSPKGTNIPKSKCAKLDKALYGLVETAHQFHPKFSNVLLNLGFTKSYANTWLFFRNNHHGRVIMVIRINDCYLVGDKPAFYHMTKELHDKGVTSSI
jgi:Reverse transcriptase (RNA-dependent DNA polymerase)